MLTALAQDLSLPGGSGWIRANPHFCQAVLDVWRADWQVIGDRDRDLLDDFKAEALERRDVHGRVGEQANPSDSQIEEDLATETDGADNALLMSFVVGGLGA